MDQTNSTKPLPQSSILLVSVTPFFGGGESYLIKLAEMLVKDYSLCAIVAEPRSAAAMLGLGIQTEQLPSMRRSRLKRYSEMARVLWRTCRSRHPDVVHLNGQGECHLWSLFLLLGIPTVAIRHTPLYGRLVSRAMRPLVSLEYGFASAVVCVSELLRSQLFRAGVPGEKLHSIPNWIESGRVISRVGQRAQANGTFRIAVVGRLDALKGVMDVIVAMKQLPGVVLEIVGDGPQRAELEAAAKGLPVFFHGFQQDCTRFYENADLLVFPSYVEGQPLVPLEAMARGTACLLSNIEATLETSDNGRCAALFRCGDPEDLARQVRALQNDPERLHELRVAGLERVKQVYTEDAVRDRYLALYESVIQQHASKRKSGRGRKRGKAWQASGL